MADDSMTPERHVEILSTIRDANAEKILELRDRLFDAKRAANKADERLQTAREHQVDVRKEINRVIRACVFELDKSTVDRDAIKNLLKLLETRTQQP